jgi:cation diffusion facilitator CzcD-associated flavoprotein CzcO
MSVVVVGAGAAGLAVAGTLRERGVNCTMLERSTAVGSAWAGRYDSLQLHTVRWLSGLPGQPIPKSYGRWVPRDDMVRYLGAYAASRGVTPEFGVEVSGVERDGPGWQVHSSAGSHAASAVVMATGFSSKPYLPAWAAAPGLPLVHSSDYRNAAPYVGKHVLVVGAGNSAAEIAVDLVRAGATVSMSVRTPPNIVRRDTFGVPSQLLGIALRHVPESVMNPMSAVLRKVSVPDLSDHGLPAPNRDGFTQFLRTHTVPILDHGFVDEVRAGRIAIVPAVTGISAGEVQLAGGDTMRPDAVVAATGYRPGLEPIVGHLGVLDKDGVPLVHGARTLASAPGLYFAGITVLLAGLLREIGIEAKAIGDAIGASTP